MAEKFNNDPSEEKPSEDVGTPDQAPPIKENSPDKNEGGEHVEITIPDAAAEDLAEGHVPDARDVQSSVKKGLESAISAAMSSAKATAEGDNPADVIEGEFETADAKPEGDGGTSSEASDDSVLSIDVDAVAIDEEGQPIGRIEASREDTETPREKDIIELEFEANDIRYDDGEPDFEMAFDESGVLTIKHNEHIVADDNLLSIEPDAASIVADEENPFVEESAGESAASDTRISDDDLEAFKTRCARAYERKRKEYLKRKRRTSEEELAESGVVVQDEIVLAIKQEGERFVKYDVGIKEYLKHSNDAINNFRVALKPAIKTFNANFNEREAPMMIAEIIKIYGKILEIRCDNLQNLVKVKAHSHIRKIRIALHEDIDNYNEYVVMYSTLTGEKLTRMSTFLPENIADGKVTAVVPVLSYKDSYVQRLPDKNGKITPDASTTVISPIMTADGLFGKYKPPRSRLGCAIYRARAVRAEKKLRRSFDLLGKMITETNLAERRYENELKRLDITFRGKDKDSEEYRKKVFAINMKYGRAITSISTLKTRNAFSRTKIRLLIAKLSVERENLVVAYNFLRETYRYGKLSQKKFAEAFFVGAMYSYNKCAELCSRVTGTEFAEMPSTLVERVCRGEEIFFPLVAYKREIIETVGDESRVISTSLKEGLTPEEEAYYEGAQMIFGNSGVIRDSEEFLDESAMTDRAAAISSVLLQSLRDGADAVSTTNEYESYLERSKKVIKLFKRALKASERAISRAFDENGVITALVENLRVLSNLVETRRINVALAERMDKSDKAKSECRALYRNIELYNGRAMDYMTIVGEQFTRISSMSSHLLLDSADSIKVPTITYKDNYIEVFPKDPLDEALFENPSQRNEGIYTPLLMQHYRLTENRAVITTVVNAPFVFDVTIDDHQIESWWHPRNLLELLFVLWQPIVAVFRRWLTNLEIWAVDESLLFARDNLKHRRDKNTKRHQKYEMRLMRLNEEHKARLLALETVIHDTDRHTAAYQKKLYKINAKYSRSIYKLKMKWMRGCHGRTDARLMLERLVIDRERIIGMNKVLLKFRSYGRITFFRNVLSRYKKRFYDAVVAHNETAKRLSELIGTPFSEVSTAVADDIIRYGNVVKFPEIVCCREIVETVESVSRTVGDRWHGFGLYTGTSGSDAGSGNSPVMSVGAMGYSTDMGVPYLRADFGGMSMLGMTKGGVPLIGFVPGGGVGTSSMRAGTDIPIINDAVPLNGLPLVEYPGVDGPIIPFAGVPMMLTGTDKSPVLEAGLYEQNGPMLGAVNVNNPYSGVNTRALDSSYVNSAEEAAKVGIQVETSIDIASQMVEDHFMRSLRARSMTLKDGARSWWKLIGSEINTRFMKSLMLKNRTFLGILIPHDDKYLENINTRVNPEEEKLLVKITRLGAIIDMETKRLYSAAKVGIRRSERKWSSWLLRDIEKYNELVRSFNELRVSVGDGERVDPIAEINIDDIKTSRLSLDDDGQVSVDTKPKLRTTKPLNEWLDQLSLNIPYEIVQREDVRPPAPPKLSYRNRVVLDEDTKAFMTDHMVKPLYKYANDYIFGSIFKRIFIGPIIKLCMLIEFGDATLLDEDFDVPSKRKLGPAGALMMRIIRSEIKSRSKQTYVRRQKNEDRHYYIRREKSLNMKKYNKRLLRAIGYANDPIRYQQQMNKALRKYLAVNFRIDYNMRIWELVSRCMQINNLVFYVVSTALIIAMMAVMLISPDSNLMWITLCVALGWAVMPVAIFVLKLVYWIGCALVSFILLITKNAPLLTYGAKSVEENRNSIILSCFITEQYKLLSLCEHFRRKTKSRKCRKQLIKAVNDYNRDCEKYSEILRIPINKIDITRLTDKLIAEDAQPLNEIQNFMYARELIESVDIHKTGEKLSEREFVTLVSELNKKIDKLQLPENMENADTLRLNNLAGKIRDLGYWISSDANPTTHERYKFKRDLYKVVEELRLEGVINDVDSDAFCRDAFRIADYLGGRPRQRIIRVLARDNMVIDFSKKNKPKKDRPQK